MIDSSVVMITALSSQMKTTPLAIEEFDEKIAELCASHDDYPLFASLPGSGSIYSARMLAALGTDRDRFRSPDEVACLFGIAPVKEAQRPIELDEVAVLAARSSCGRVSTSMRGSRSSTRPGRGQTHA